MQQWEGGCSLSSISSLFCSVLQQPHPLAPKKKEREQKDLPREEGTERRRAPNSGNQLHVQWERGEEGGFLRDWRRAEKERRRRETVLLLSDFASSSSSFHPGASKWRRAQPGGVGRREEREGGRRDGGRKGCSRCVEWKKEERRGELS